MNAKKGKCHDRGKPYGKDKGRKNDFGGGSKPSGGEEMKCYNCGRFGHRASDCKNATTSCFLCGKAGHCAVECNGREIVCYNCGEAGHISTKCTKPNKEKAGDKSYSCIP